MPSTRGQHRLLSIPSLVLLLSLLAPAGCTTFGGGGEDGSLAREIREIISAPPLDQVHWGILIQDADTRRVLFSRNAERKFIPASNMKVLTTATALSLWGPDHRFRTEAWGVGRLNPESGELDGDLVIRPSGDPTFSQRFHPDDTAPLDSLAARLAAAGLRDIRGRVLVDASAWDSTTVPGTWNASNLPYYYAAGGGVLAIAEGAFGVEVRGGGAEGDDASWRWWPEPPRGFTSTYFRTAHPDSTLRWSLDYLPESRRLRIRGRVPAGNMDTLWVAQRDPVGVATSALLTALEAHGIRSEDGLRVSWTGGEALAHGHCVTGNPSGAATLSDTPLLPDCPGATLLATLESPPLVEIVRGVLKPSQNWMAEQLVRAMGAAFGERGSRREGLEVEEDFLRDTMAVDSLDLSLNDGSGLSSYNLVTPRAMVRILEFMRGSPHGEIYREALAEPQDSVGTLRSRLEGLEGQLFAKTGTISNVNSLSGYLVTDGGREVIFSVLTNGSGLPSRRVRAAIDQVVRAAARR